MSILLLSGPSGTGKTSLAHALCESHDGHHVSERELCHKLANEHGFERTRYWIEDAGAEQVGLELCARTAEVVCAMYAGRLLVVDGVYQPQLVQEITTTRGERPAVGFVDAHEPLRLSRVARRLGTESLAVARQEMCFLDAVKGAFGMADMRQAANWELDGNQETAALQIEVEGLLGLKPSYILG